MLIFRKCFREYICHIFVCLYVGVVDYSSSMHISTVVIAHLNVRSSRLDDSCGDKSESTPVVAVDWKWW